MDENILLSAREKSSIRKLDSPPVSNLSNSYSKQQPQFQYSNETKLEENNNRVYSNSPYENPTQTISQRPTIDSYQNNNFQRKRLVKENNLNRNAQSVMNALNADSKNEIPANISHSVVNNGSTITITTTIQTNSDGDIHVSSDVNESGKLISQLDSDSRPENYEKLTAKGGGEIPTKIDGFETVIFPKKQLTKQFEFFLKEEKKKAPKNWQQSNKYR